MNRYKTLQMMFFAFLGTAIAAMLIGSWLPRQMGRVSGLGAVSWFLPAFGVVVLAHAVLTIFLYKTQWTPLCEQALKMVWAGRLTNAQQGKALTQKLFGAAVVMFALCETPAIYGMILSILEPSKTDWAYALAGASYAGLGAFYWYGMIPASGVFRHVERVLQAT